MTTNRDLNISEVEAALLAQEAQLKAQGAQEGSITDAAYYSNTGRMNGRPRNSIECYNCHKRGHIAAECRTETASDTGSSHHHQQGRGTSRGGRGGRGSYRGPYNSGSRGGRGRGRGRNAQAHTSTIAFVSTVHSDSASGSPKSSTAEDSAHRQSKSYYAAKKASSAKKRYATIPWVVDTGSTHHICKDAEVFIHLDCSTQPKSVITGGGERVPIRGIGTAIIQTSDHRIELHNCYYVPGFDVNLMSTKQAMQSAKAEVEFHLKRDRCIILADNKPWLEIPTEPHESLTIIHSEPPYHTLDSASPITTDDTTTYSYLTKAPETAQLWHLRYGHLGYDGLAKLVRHEMIEGININANDFSTKQHDACDPCILSKHHRMPFSPSTQSTTAPLDLIHMDLCGPMPTKSLGGGLYFATILDDYSGLSVVKILKRKSEVKSFIIDTFALLENSIDSKVKRVRTDNGREYINEILSTYYKSKGIHNETTVAYHPEQNGKAERLNRTLTERERSMRFEASLPDRMWAESIMTANYIHNRSPRTGQQMTPYEAFYKRKPNVSNLRVFGSTAYAHIPKEQRNKLQPRAAKGVMVGYSTDKKAYRLYANNAVMISRDVVFDERSMLKTHSDVTCDDSTSDEPSATPNTDDVLDDKSEAKESFSPQLHSSGMTDADGAGVLGSHDYSGKSQTSARENDTVKTHARDPYMNDGLIDETVRAYVTQAAEQLSPDPLTFEEAMRSPDAAQWLAAVLHELKSIVSHGVLNTTRSKPTHIRALAVKWVFKRKYDARGVPDKYKARLVVKGYEQEYGINYSEVFSPTSRHATLRAFLAHVVQNRMPLHSMDVMTAFLQASLDEEVWIQSPPGFSFKQIADITAVTSADTVLENATTAHTVATTDITTGNVVDDSARLMKGLYGMKQAPRLFYLHMKAKLEKLGFKAASSDPALFIKHTKEGTVLILTYVDDMLIAATYTSMIDSIKRDLHKEFEIRDLGETKEHLNMTIEYDMQAGKLKLAQEAAILKAIETFGMTNHKFRSLPMSPADIVVPTGKMLSELHEYRSMVGTLLYFAVTTRPDISFAVGVLTRYMSSPTTDHFTFAQNVLSYLHDTANLGLVYHAYDTAKFEGFSDSDWAADKRTRNSTTAYVFTYNDTAVSWNSKLQKSVAASTMEAEFYAGSQASRECIWLGYVWNDLTNSTVFDNPLLHIDNQSAIRLITDTVISQRSKHIDIAYHFIREKVASGKLRVQYLQTDRMVADSLTKAVPKDKFIWCRLHMGVA